MIFGIRVRSQTEVRLQDTQSYGTIAEALGNPPESKPWWLSLDARIITPLRASLWEIDLSVIKRVFELIRAGKKQIEQIELLYGQISSQADEISLLQYYLGVNQHRRLPLHGEPGQRIAKSTQEFWDFAKQDVLRADPKVVLDIGCGVRPFGLVRFNSHVCLEPFSPYATTLAKRFPSNTGIMPIMALAPDDLWRFPDKSVDSVFLLDVIEHMDKEVGKKVLLEAKRISKKASHVFTPLGFMEQHVSKSDLDEWGYEGNSLQTHLSGWDLEDFSDYEVTVMEKYHELESGDFGAIWASHYHDEPKAALTLSIPEALDANADWSRWLREIEKRFFFSEVNVSAEMAPWSFRAKQFVEFPPENLGIASASKLQAELGASLPGPRRIVLCTKSLASQLVLVSPPSKVLVLVEGDVSPNVPRGTNKNIKFVALEDRAIESALEWIEHR